MLNYVLMAALSYLVGSVPSGVMVGRIARSTDIRERGSGNTGTTNAFRALGWRLGLLVALMDFAKGYVAVALISTLAPFPAAIGSASASFVVATLASVLGHVKPIFAGFKGGKGFATAAGAITAAFPLLAPFCLVIFLGALTLTGFVAICAIVTSAALPILYFLTSRVSQAGTDPVILGFFIVAFLLTALSVRRRLLEYLTGKAELFEKVMLFKPRRKETGQP
ncbi:MAG TPA: glycerol-3-phosphate acyltransferase [Rectinemataceae bacterium]|nr:glycerol-3-phosphate acyltransferase [Rectinemataceae bacterium]